MGKNHTIRTVLISAIIALIGVLAIGLVAYPFWDSVIDKISKDDETSRGPESPADLLQSTACRAPQGQRGGD